MSITRSVFFQLLTVALLLLTISISWNFSAFTQGANSEDAAASSISSAEKQFEERAFSYLVQVILGTMKFFGERYQNGGDQSPVAIKEVNADLKKTFYALSLENHPVIHPGKHHHPPPVVSPRLLIKQAISCYAVGFDAEAAVLINAVNQAGEHADPDLQQIVRIVQPAISAAASNQTQNPATAQATISEADVRLLREHLGWFGLLFVVSSPYDGPDRSSLEEQVFKEALHTSIRSFMFGAIAIALITMSVLFSVSMVYLILMNRLAWRFKLPSVSPDFCLEIFALYLLGMLLSSQATRLFQADAIRLSILTIPCLLGLVCWPIINGISRQDLITALGFRLESVNKVVRDIIAGPFVYVASLINIVIVVSFYLLFLEALNVNTSSGTHPIVPILISDEDRTRSYLIVALAVIIAPLVEEVMFRGALYSWLRARMGAVSAIFTSSAVFAAVHPQGLVGLVPLMAIGATLALLREWRGSLIAPIIAHACFNAGTLVLIRLVLM